MRLVVSLVCLAVASCVTDTGSDEASTATSGLTGLIESADSVNWDPAVGCQASPKAAIVPCDGAFLWPDDQGIKSAEVLYRKGPDGSEGATFLAFVVWNENTVGRIVRASVGRNGAHLRTTINNITVSRTAGAPDNSTSSAGNLGGGTSPPQPHPHIDEAIHFSEKYLNAAKIAAKNIRNASDAFTAYFE